MTLSKQMLEHIIAVLKKDGHSQVFLADKIAALEVFAQRLDDTKAALLSVIDFL